MDLRRTTIGRNCETVLIDLRRSLQGFGANRPWERGGQRRWDGVHLDAAPPRASAALGPDQAALHAKWLIGRVVHVVKIVGWYFSVLNLTGMSSTLVSGSKPSRDSRAQGHRVNVSRQPPLRPVSANAAESLSAVCKGNYLTSISHNKLSRYCIAPLVGLSVLVI